MEQRNNKARQQRYQTEGVRRTSPDRAFESSHTARDDGADELEGQLGPDELPDAQEVMMSKHAKHRA